MVINVPDQIKEATVASSRNPSIRASVAWDRALSSTKWFRLDESILDGPGVLSLITYGQDETPNEIISEADKFIYSDETNNVISAEGLSEFWGDLDQAILSELDIVLDNSDGRYTPLDDKNILGNPSFESQLFRWNSAVVGGELQTVGSGPNAVSGSAAARLTNPDSDPITSNYAYSDTYTIASGAAYTGSVFARGTGDFTMRIVGIGSGSNAVSTGSQIFTLASGEFRRFSLMASLPIEATTARIDFATSSGAVIVDCAQLEQSNIMTSYDDDFIGDLILPRRPTKIQIEMLDRPSGSGGTIPSFMGLTETLEPSIRNNTISIHSYDFGRELKDKKAMLPTSTGPRMFVNQQTDELLIHLADMAGLEAGDFSFETGKNNVPFFWIQEGSVWFYMSTLAEAEGGRLFFDEDGILNFWNRDHIDNNINSQFQFTNEDNILDSKIRVDKDEIINHVKVRTNPRTVQANQNIWSLEASEEILSGENKTIWINLDDPITGATQPTSTGSTSFIRGNTLADGSGVDVSANMFIQEFTVFARDIKLVVDNQSSKDAHITDIAIWGTPAKVTKKIEVEVENTDSISNYGRSTLAIENDYILNESFATNLAQDKLFNLKDPRTKVRLTTVGIPYLQLGDVVTVPDGVSAKVRNLYIKRKRWQILDGDYIEYLELEQKTLAVFFRLDISRLDGTDVLSE